MAMSKRERLIAIGTGAAVALFAGDRYVVTPYFEARAAVAKEREAVSGRMEDAQRTFNRQKRLNRDWEEMVTGGLKSNAGDAEQQLYEAVREWAREAGVTIQNSDPQRVPRADRTQIVRLRVSGSGTTAAFSKLLWRIETSALPVKVDEFTLTSRSQGNDDLAVSMAVSTIWIRPPGADDAKGARPAAPPRRPAGGEEL